MDNTGAAHEQSTQPKNRRIQAVVAATLAATATMVVLDLTWLGVVARGWYDALLGPLKRPDVYLPAAVLFYSMYLCAVMLYAVLGAHSPSMALRRGAAFGLVTYATYDLTNWAVLQGWPALLVPIDIAWGIFLTALVAMVGKYAHTWGLGRNT